MQDSLKANISRFERVSICAVIGFCFFVIISMFLMNRDIALNIFIVGLIGGASAVLIHILYRDWRLWVLASTLTALSAAAIPFVSGYVGPAIDMLLLLGAAGIGAFEAHRSREAFLRENQVMKDIRKVNGRHLKVRVHKDDVRAPYFAVVYATIEEAAFLEDGRSFLIVRPDSFCAKGEDLVIEKMVLLGIDLSIVQELFGVSRRALGRPVVAGIYHLEDDAMKEQTLASRTIPTDCDYLGRAAVFLDSRPHRNFP